MRLLSECCPVWSSRRDLTFFTPRNMEKKEGYTMQVVVPHVNCEMLFVCQKQLLQTQYVQHVQKSENTHIVNNIYKPSINIHGETENLQVLNECVTSMQIVKLKKKIAVQCSEEKGKSRKVPLFFALCPRALCSRIRTRYFNLTCPSLRWVITGFTRRTLIIIINQSETKK